MSYAFGYARISHATGYEKGESIDGQRLHIENYFKMQLAPKGVKWGGIHDDAGSKSASKVRFPNRPAGKVLIQKLQQGDHLIVDKVDRLWRCNKDFVSLMEYFKANGVTVHIVNMMGCSLEMGTPMGNFMLSIMVLIAELEAGMISSRTKAGFEIRREKGMVPYAFSGAAVPISILVTGKKEKRRLYWNARVRKVQRQILRWWLKEKRSDREIQAKFYELWTAEFGLGKVNGRDVLEWHAGFIWERLIRQELIYYLMGTKNPNELWHPSAYDIYQKLKKSLKATKFETVKRLVTTATGRPFESIDFEKELADED
jgi:DNA invertase Pin-like site-specific DNA recombinase